MALISETISPGYALGTLLVLGFAYILYKCILAPYLLIRYYKKQGGVAMFHKELLGFFKNMRNAREKGNFFHIYKEIVREKPDARFIAENLSSRVLLILNDTEMIKEMLQKYEIYHKDEEISGHFFELMGGSTGFSEGLAWKRRRRVLAATFNFEFLKDMVPAMVDLCEEEFNEWVKNNQLSNVNVVERIAFILGEITGRLFFGKKYSGRRIKGKLLSSVSIEAMYELFNEGFTLSNALFGPKLARTNILPRHRRINETIASMRGTYKEMILETEKNPIKENSLVNRLLELRNSPNEEDRLTDEQIVGEFSSLFGAGTDTSSSVINCALYYLSKNPKMLQKVREEIDREFADPSSITMDNLNRMDYTAAVFKEANRLTTTGLIFYRIATQDDNLCGVNIKKSTLLNVYINVVHTNPKYFTNPEEFIPERWMPNTPESQDNFKQEPYSYLPFSAGPRNCVGQHLGVISMKVIMGLLLRRFNYKIPENFEFNLMQGLVLAPLDPILVTFEPRKN